MGYYGELAPRTSMRGYWKLEDLTDSSGNGFNLTNLNSVTFTSGRFGNCADFGSSGTNKALSTLSAILSANIVTQFTASCWVRFNNATSTNASAGIFDIRQGSGSGFTEMILRVDSISGGTINLRGFVVLATTLAQVTFSIPADTTTWHNIVCVRTSATGINIYVDGNLVGSGVGSGSDTAQVGTYNFSIGNNRNTTVQVWADIDEVIVEERVWSAQEARRYYEQATGRLAPKLM